MSRNFVPTIHAIQTAWKKGLVLGKGAYGEARLITINDIKYVAKMFIAATTADAKIEKKEEESKHLELWSRLDRGCRMYFCRPIRSLHPAVSLQIPAGDDHHTVETLKTFALKKNKPSLNTKLTKIYNNTNNALRILFADALRCMHMAGAVHGDVKWDNALVVYKTINVNGFDVIKSINVKLIDMGLAILARGNGLNSLTLTKKKSMLPLPIPGKKSLVRTTITQRGTNYNRRPNINGIRKILNKQRQTLKNKGFNNGMGYYFNNTWIVPFSELNKKLVKSREKAAIRQKAFLQNKSIVNSTIEKHYARAVRHTENAAVKLIEKRIKRRKSNALKKEMNASIMLELGTPQARASTMQLNNGSLSKNMSVSKNEIFASLSPIYKRQRT